MKVSTSALAFSAALLVSSTSGFSSLNNDVSRTSPLSMASDITEPSSLSTKSSVVKVAAQGMSLLKPVFKLEAELQAAALGALAKVDKDQVAQEVSETIAQNKVVIYTYSLSPFSTEALALLDASGYDYTKIELGAEWFVLGGKASETRVALSKEVVSGATSLPKIFIGGSCIGGYAELAALVESGELDGVMKKAGARKQGEATQKAGFFSFFN